MSTDTAVLRAQPEHLRARMAGPVHGPLDPGYADAASPWNLAFVHRPAMVAEPESTADVVAAVRFAAEVGLPVAVQATGHGVALVADDALLLSLRRLTDVEIDPVQRTARIAGGAKWDRVLGPAQDVGLAPLLGSTPDVGAVGYTLGGGFGWIGRRFGLSADHVRSFELVTADGQVRDVTPDTDPELFWALRGAGAGSLGVVTAMVVQLVPVTRVYAGNLLYPAEDALEVGRRYRDWIETVPDTLTSSLCLMNFPPVEDVPAPVRGRSFVIIRGCFVGDDDEGEELLRHWRDWRAPELDLWGPMSFRDVAEISNDPLDPMPGASTSEWLTDLGDPVLETLAATVFPADGPPRIVVGEVRHAGGAITRPELTAAYGNRDAQLLLQLIGVSETPGGDPELLATMRAARAALDGHTTGGAYLNFLEGDEKVERAAAGLAPGARERLRSVKARVDPEDRFRHGLPLS